jgi:hypothetical protein
MTHGSTHDRPRRAARHRLAAVLAVAVLLSGCGGTDPAAPDNEPENKQEKTSEKKPEQTITPRPGPHYTVEQLAAKLGCTPKFRGPTKGFRQGFCTKDGEEIVLLDFESARDQYLWLTRAIGAGGIYLVGDRWGLSGVSEEWMESQGKILGGTVEDKYTWDP